LRHGVYIQQLSSAPPPR